MMQSISSIGHGKYRTLLTLTSSLALFCAVSSASAGALERAKQTGKLTLGYSTETRPYSFKNDAGSPDGYAVELCKRVADAAKAELKLPSLSVNFVPLKREEGLRAVAQGKVDLLCDPFTPTVVNRKEVSFSLPIIASGVGVIVRSDAASRLKETLSGEAPPTRPNWRANMDQALQRSTLSAVAGSHAEQVLSERLKDLKIDPKLAPVSDPATGIKAVADRHSDAFFGDLALLRDAAQQHTGSVQLQVLDRYFTYDIGALAVSRSDEDFRLFVDRLLSKIYSSPEFKPLYSKWFGSMTNGVNTFYQLNILHD